MVQVLSRAQALDVAVEVEGDEAAARRSLRDQVARLERELSDTLLAAFPHGGVVTAGAAPGDARRATPRLQSLGELEVQRDRLAGRLAVTRRLVAERAAREEEARVRLERMRLAPGRHRLARVAAADLGEGGCGVYAVRPRLGLIGMLMGWWHIKLSSGCGLAT
jgi:hypothetical protein